MIDLSVLFKDTSLNYEAAKKEKFGKQPLIKKFQNSIPNKLRELLGNDWSGLLIKASVGQGQWASVPWCAFFNPLITKSAQKGIFVVYLFNTGNQKIYLSLNQGTQSVKDEFGSIKDKFGKKEYINVLNQRAAIYRAELSRFNSLMPLSQIVGFDGKIAEGYGAGHILGFEYDANSLPADTILVENLKTALDAYSCLIYKDNFASDMDVNDHGLQFITERRNYKIHQRIERSSYAKAIKEQLGVKCQCCGMDFEDRYGEIGKGFIELHHLIPLYTLEIGIGRKYDVKKDFAVLCANCHRMIHKQEDPSDLNALKARIKS